MSERILSERPVQSVSRLVEKIHAGMGYRMVERDGRCICDDGPSTWERAARFSATLVRLHPDASVAIIGAGMCVLPRVLARFKITVFEVEPALVEYCPEGVGFVPGDWRETLHDSYDAIIYDIGDQPDQARLRAHLNPGGLLIGEPEFVSDHTGG